MQRLLILACLAAAAFAPAFGAGAASASTPRRAARSAHLVHRTAASVSSRNPVSTAEAIAEGYWGAVPCQGQIRLAAESPLARGLDPSTDGWVTFDSSFGANDLDAPATSYTNCKISLARWQWASWTDMEGDWGMFCLTVIHEMGHLLGHKHSLVRGSVMAPVFTSDANVPAVCNATWLPGWRSGARN
jgi:hypothetical protein